MPRDSRIAPREAAAMPFPRLETTPPVTNMNFVMLPRAQLVNRYCTGNGLRLEERWAANGEKRVGGFRRRPTLYGFERRPKPRCALLSRTQGSTNTLTRAVAVPPLPSEIV